MSNYPDRAAPDIVFDNRLECYRSYFDHAWADAFFDMSARSRVDDAAIVLARDWLSAALSGQLPWLNVKMVESYHEGISTRPPLPHQLLTAIGEDITKDAKLSNMRRKAIMQKIGERSAQLQAAWEAQRFDAQAMWQGLLTEKQYALGIWSLQRMAYNAFYQAYENFIQRVIEIGRNDTNYRARHPQIRERDFVALFGQQLADECINDDPMDTARLVRNCLSHDGGRESADLRQKAHAIPVVEGQLQLMPEHVSALFNALKSRATRIVEAAAQMPAYAHTSSPADRPKAQ